MIVTKYPTVLPGEDGATAPIPWPDQLRDELASVRAQHRAALLSNHPGAPWLIADLLLRERCLERQLAEEARA